MFMVYSSNTSKEPSSVRLYTVIIIRVYVADTEKYRALKSPDVLAKLNSGLSYMPYLPDSAAPTIKYTAPFSVSISPPVIGWVRAYEWS